MNRLLCLLVVIAGCASKLAPEPAAPEATAALAAAPAGIRRAEVLAAVERGLGQLLARSEVAPVVRDGIFVGFAVVHFERASDLARVGLAPGDVLLAVGGKPIRTPDEAQLAFEGLRAAPSIVLEIERAGAKKTLTTPIAP